MDSVTLLRQGLLFAHVLTFAIALSAVLRADLALLKGRPIDAVRLARTARAVSLTLLLLWLTGLGMLALDGEPIAVTLQASAKLAAKLVVVSALTANGFVLHALAFPRLTGQLPRPARGLGVAWLVVLGAISTASWLYASFIGVSRLVAPAMSFADFMAIYSLLLAGGIAIGLVFVRPRVARGMERR